MSQLPKGKWNVVYADPAWDYHNFGDDNSKLHGAVNSQYSTMPTEAICKLDVASITEDNAILYLWATLPKLPDAVKVMAAWGFEHKTGLVWVKQTPRVGFWFMGQAELLLLGTKGQVPVVRTKASNVFKIGATNHSSKPQTFRTLIEKWTDSIGFRKRIELFARIKAYTWDAWGNEIIPTITLEEAEAKE